MAGRLVMSWTVTIDRPPAEVYAYLSDVTKHSEWSPKPFRVESGASGPVKTGDTFSSVGTIPGDKNHRNEVSVTEATAPSRLVLEADEKDGRFVNTFDLQPQGAGTLLTRTMDAPKPGFPMSMMMPVIKAVFIQPDVSKGLNNLKANLEEL
jgi:uncharacterized protein YndB with AHSA1/START domain